MHFGISYQSNPREFFSMRLLVLGLIVPTLGGFLQSAPNLPRLSVPKSAPAPSSRVDDSDLYARAIEKLDGRAIDAQMFPNTIDGFQAFLEESGIRNVTAAELTRPNHPGVAERLGFREFLPPQNWWRRGAALALLVQRLRTVVHEPLYVRNWWRPASYNADPAVGGARNGDHPTANAVDLDYASRAGRMRAERWLRTLDRNARWLQLSLGLGDRTTHVGIGSVKGRREWHYAGWRPATAA